MITILNAPVITSWGTFQFRQATLDEVKAMIDGNEWQSAIGHEATAQIVSKLLDINCPRKRIAYKQGVGDTAIVFRLNKRIGEGTILTIDEIGVIGYSWGILTRTE